MHVMLPLLFTFCLQARDLRASYDAPPPALFYDACRFPRAARAPPRMCRWRGAHASRGKSEVRAAPCVRRRDAALCT